MFSDEFKTMNTEPSVIIEKLKEKMLEAGYNTFSVSEENESVVLEVQQNLVENSRPCFWDVLDDLGISFDGGMEKVTIAKPPFGVRLPAGQYNLTK